MSNNINQEQFLNNSDEVSLKDMILSIKSWWNFILSKWLIILLSGLIGGIIGVTYIWIQKPIYNAKLSFAIQDDNSSRGIGALGLASQLGIDLGGSTGGEFSGDNLLEFMRSRVVVEKALLTTITINNKPETLVERYIRFNKIREDWQKNPELKNISFLPNADRSNFDFKKDSILGVFYKQIGGNFSVDKIDKKLSIYNLQVSSNDELFSKYFAEVLIKVVTDYYIQTTTNREAKNVALLQHQTDSVRRVLGIAISNVANSIDAAPNANPALQALRVPSQRKQIEVGANTVMLNELVRNLEIAKMSLLQETPLIQVIDKPILPLDNLKSGKSKGLVFGALLLGILSVIWLSVKRVFSNL